MSNLPPYLGIALIIWSAEIEVQGKNLPGSKSLITVTPAGSWHLEGNGMFKPNMLLYHHAMWL